MAQIVVIEGTLTPAAGVLERGRRKTVPRTARIDRLVAGGFIRIVEVKGGHADHRPETDTVTEQIAEDAAQDDTPESVGQSEQDDVPTEDNRVDEIVKWLEAHDAEIPVVDGRRPNKAGLLEIVQTVVDGA